MFRWSSADRPRQISATCTHRAPALWAFPVIPHIQGIAVLAGLLSLCRRGNQCSMIKLFRKLFSLIIPVSFVFCNNFESDYEHGSAL